MTIDDTIDYRLYLVQREIIKHYNRNMLKPYDLSYQHYLVLMVLNEYGQMPVLQLGEKLAFQSGTITPIIKKMEARGLISRIRSKEDERVVHVELTESGHELIQQLDHVPLQMLKESQLEEEEYSKLMYLSKKIVKNMHY